MRTIDILRAWGRILAGRMPSLSIEITRRCPLSCPGCYAYSDAHLGAAGSLAQMREYEGKRLVEGVLQLVDHHRPLHLSIVGGEPLIRWREITELLPALEKRGIHTQVVTSAVRPIPAEWRVAPRLNIVVSIDGLQPEHDKRRAPATYERILRHIQGHSITVHCTVTRQMTDRAVYLREFVDFWASRPEVRKIWMSLFTPQKGEAGSEVLPPEARARVIDDLSTLKNLCRKLELPEGLLQAYRQPPNEPDKCVFALTTRTVSADLKTAVTPCQLGGDPDCRQCGCIASAALEAVNRHRLPLGIRTGVIYKISRIVGHGVQKQREVRLSGRPRRRAGVDAGGAHLAGEFSPMAGIGPMPDRESWTSL